MSISKNIIITGAAGFIGSNLCHALHKKNHNIIAIDNLYTGYLNNIEDLISQKNFQFHKHDIIDKDYSFLDDIKIDEIYNFACPASPPKYQKDPIFTTMTSVVGTNNLLEIAKKNNAKFLQASTSEVYGDPKEHPQKESYFGNVNPCGPRSCYDEGKRCAESLIMDYHKMYNLNAKIIRIFNTYGPNMDADDGRVVTNFINQALNNQDITIYGDGQQTRSFCYVDDLVSAIITYMDSYHEVGPINLGNPDEFTVAELAELTLKLIPDSKSKIIFEDLPTDDPKKRKPDITKANQLLKWDPEVNLEQGLNKTITYFSQKKNIN